MTMRVANSSQSGIPWNPKVTATLKRNATEMASAINVIIAGSRALSSATAPWRKTRPPYPKTAAPKSAGIQWTPGKTGGVYPSSRGAMCPQIRMGAVSASETQNRSRNIATLWPACWSWPSCA